MGQIIVNVPDCGVTSSSGRDVITVDTSGCPVQQPEVPPLVPWYAIVLGSVVLIVALVATGMVRFRRHDRLETERKDELAAEVEMAKAARSCQTCGADYKPKVK